MSGWVIRYGKRCFFSLTFEKNCSSSLGSGAKFLCEPIKSRSLAARLADLYAGIFLQIGKTVFDD